ncbi:hypothetical protein [Lacticaseibacillus camelliae]|uniref:hypothetical protein n=1 Tax=Lacticaseibacillus camelliae TaxID=381742 RepID=UPI000A9AA8F5|nr:hypothetical protein [Lacticaseibacillus camelliae]
MSRNVILYLTESLDGFIAEPNGSTEWLRKLNSNAGDDAYQASTKMWTPCSWAAKPTSAH